MLLFNFLFVPISSAVSSITLPKKLHSNLHAQFHFIQFGRTDKNHAKFKSFDFIYSLERS